MNLNLLAQEILAVTGKTLGENLEELNCQACPVQTLDLSGNPKLKNLDVSETKLTALDLSSFDTGNVKIHIFKKDMIVCTVEDK